MYHLLFYKYLLSVFTIDISESDLIVEGPLVGTNTRSPNDSIMQVILDSRSVSYPNLKTPELERALDPNQ